MWGFGFTLIEASITGIAAAFSSTILGIKLLPTTVLHHRHVGEIVVSLLLIQDLLAIFALIVINGSGTSIDATLTSLGQSIAALPVLMALAFIKVDEAIVLFQKNVKDYPDSWNVYDCLAERLEKKGDVKGAVTNYEKALKMVGDEQNKKRITETLTRLRAK